MPPSPCPVPCMSKTGSVGVDLGVILYGFSNNYTEAGELSGHGGTKSTRNTSPPRLLCASPWLHHSTGCNHGWSSTYWYILFFLFFYPNFIFNPSPSFQFFFYFLWFHTNVSERSVFSQIFALSTVTWKKLPILATLMPQQTWQWALWPQGTSSQSCASVHAKLADLQ